MNTIQIAGIAGLLCALPATSVPLQVTTNIPGTVNWSTGSRTGRYAIALPFKKDSVAGDYVSARRDA